MKTSMRTNGNAPICHVVPKEIYLSISVPNARKRHVWGLYEETRHEIQREKIEYDELRSE